MSVAPPPVVTADALTPTGRIAIGLVRVLRGAGLTVPVGALLEFTRALRLLGLGDPDAIYFAGQATLITRPEDLALYDRCFRAFFTTQMPGPIDDPDELSALHLVELDDEPLSAEQATGTEQPGLARYSARELLRERDFATLSDEERDEAAQLLAEIRFSLHSHVTRRRRSARRGSQPDLRALVRRGVRRGGELRIDRYLEPVVRARRLVLLLDVSGSMESYSRALLRFSQLAVAGRPMVEVFALGTRLTRVTRQLHSGDADRALKASVAAIPDLSGGTRLGESLAAFNSGFGVRGLARGAVVVICSDGIDRGEPALLAAELQRLHLVTHLLVWVNPLKATAGYAPLARGMAAALPHVDRFVEGHSVQALADLAALISASY